MPTKNPKRLEFLLRDKPLAHQLTTLAKQDKNSPSWLVAAFEGWARDIDEQLATFQTPREPSKVLGPIGQGVGHHNPTRS